MKYLLFLLLLSSCGKPVMQIRKAVADDKGKLVPIENWQKYQIKKGDTITVVSRLK